MSSSDETTTGTTHERLAETRSWSEYDEDGNVTADHTTVREVCGTCYREQIDRHGHLEYVSADWPCPAAENARLRERVAALEDTADDLLSHPTPATDDAGCWFCCGGLGNGPNGHKDTCAWRRMRAALAQADETGGAR